MNRATGRYGLTEEQECALLFDAICEGVSFAERRRRALREAADEVLEDPDMREAVEAMVKSRRAQRRRDRVRSLR